MSTARSKQRREEADHERDTARERNEHARNQGIRKDQRGQEQPADKKRAQENR